MRSAATILSEKNDATMEEIASILLMTKGSIYYYFKNKEELLYQCHKLILDRRIEKIAEISKLDISPIEKIRKAIILHIIHTIDEKNMFAVFSRPEKTFSGDYLHEICKLMDDYANYYDQIIIEGIHIQAFPPLDIKIARNTILGSIHWVNQWYSPNGKMDKHEISELIANYLLRILTPENPK